MIVIAWQGHSDDSRALAESLRDAIVAVYGSEKAGAFAIGLTPQQLSRQLAGSEPFNAWRAAPPALLAKWFQLHAAKIGCSLITAEEREFILSFLGMGNRKMARFLAIDLRQKESA